MNLAGAELFFPNIPGSGAELHFTKSGAPVRSSAPGKIEFKNWAPRGVLKEGAGAEVRYN